LEAQIYTYLTTNQTIFAFIQVRYAQTAAAIQPSLAA